MTLISIVFCLLFLLTFGVAAVVLRPAKEHSLLEQRLGSLLPAGARLGTAAGAQPLLRDRSEHRGGMAAWLSGLLPVRWLEQLVYQSTSKRSIRNTLLFCSALTLIGGVTASLTTHMLPIAVVAATLLGAAPLVRLSYMRRKRLHAFNTALPDCIDLCARALRAGHSLVAAIGVAAEQAPEPARREFSEIFSKQNYGLPLRDALLETLERVPSADLRVFVTGILVQKDTGGNLTEIFDRIVLVMRERLRIEGEIRVHTAQGRMTAWILTLLPPVMFVVINVLNPGYSRPMFEDTTGRSLFYFGSVSLAVGGLLVRRIVNGIEV